MAVQSTPSVSSEATRVEPGAGPGGEAAANGSVTQRRRSPGWRRPSRPARRRLRLRLRYQAADGVAEGGEHHHQRRPRAPRPPAGVDAEQHPDAGDPDRHAHEAAPRARCSPLEREGEQEREDRRGGDEDPGERRRDVRARRAPISSSGTATWTSASTRIGPSGRACCRARRAEPQAGSARARRARCDARRSSGGDMPSSSATLMNR